MTFKLDLFYNLLSRISGCTYMKINLKERAKQLKIDIPAIFIALKKESTPRAAKVLAWIIVAYALSPIDLIPDVIPIFGYLDDVILLPTLVALFIKMIPDDVFANCRIEAEDLWQNGKPKKWYYALPIVFFWGLIVFLSIKFFIFGR